MLGEPRCGTMWRNRLTGTVVMAGCIARRPNSSGILVVYLVHYTAIGESGWYAVPRAKFLKEFERVD